MGFLRKGGMLLGYKGVCVSARKHTVLANPKESLKAACSAAVLSQEAFLLCLFLETVLLHKVLT